MWKLGTRIAIGAVAAVGLVGLSVSTAGAANLDFNGVLTVQTGPEEPGAEDEVVGSGTSTVDTTTGAFTVPQGVFVTTQTGTNSTPTAGTVFIKSTTVTLSNQTGNLQPTNGFNGGFGGLMQMAGSSKNIVAPTGNPATTLFTVTVPLGVIGTSPGSASTTVMDTFTLFFATNSITVALHGSPWGTGTTMLTDVSGDAGAGDTTTHTITATGFDNRTPGGLGEVQLVAPFTVDITSTLGAAEDDQIGVGTFNMTFVPEPGTLLLLGSGVAGLAVLGRRRRS